MAQAFETGPASYKLTRVDLRLWHAVGTVAYSVSIHSNSAGKPGASLGTLTNPSSLPGSWGLAQFTASGGGIDLAANTTYWVVLDVSTGDINTRWQFASSDGMDAGGAVGWSIGKVRSRDNDSTGSWILSIGAYRKFAVRGYATTAPEVSGATVAGTLVTVNFNATLASGNCAALRAWTVKVDGVSPKIFSLRCQSRSVLLWLSDRTRRVRHGQTVTVSYDKGQADHTIGGFVVGRKLKSLDGLDVASFSDKAVTNLMVPAAVPTGATVNGKTLTLTFGEAMDEDSVPPGAAFKVTAFHGGGPGLRECRSGWGCTVAVTDVSVSGSRATLTLEEAIPSHGSVSVQYIWRLGTLPGANRLRTAAGRPAMYGFLVRARVLAPDTAPVFSSAKITRPWTYPWLEPIEEATLSIRFNELMDESSVPPGSAFRVAARPRGGSARTIAGTGTVTVDGSGMAVKLARYVAAGETVTVSYVKPSANGLRDRAGNLLESFSGEPATNGTPRIESVAIVSDAGPDRTYGREEKVRVRVTFNGPVRVDTGGGTPRLQLSMGWSHPEKSPPDYPQGGAYFPWADYESGSGTPALTFAYTVKALDRSDGVAVWNRLELNGGWIRSRSRPAHDADLSLPQGWLPYNSAHKVDGALVVPGFQSAAVDGTALTVTFDESLDPGSVPAPGAFSVTVGSARRYVASGGVAIDGATVTLTLASAVTSSETVKVRYTKPSARPLRGASGHAVKTFADRAVTNNSPIWSATLTVRQLSGRDGCWNGVGGNRNCSSSSTLTDDSFTYKGTGYGIERITERGANPRFVFELDKAIPAGLTLHVGDDEFALADATVAGSGKRATWSNPGFAWTAGQTVQLRLTTGGSGSSGDAGSASGDAGGEPASVTGVSVVSGAGPDKTYGLGDTIHVRATFSEPVDVTGTPRLKIDMDPAHWGEKWAAYASGSGTGSLTFAHTVVEPNISTRGIAVLASTLELNGGTIRAGGADASLAHDGLAHDANHKVDWRTAGEESGGGGGGGGGGGTDGPGGTIGNSGPPSVTAVAVVSSPASGDTYLLGETIRIRATFSEAVTVTGTPKLDIDMDPAFWGTKQASYASGSGTSSLAFAHTVVEPNLSRQGIAVLANTLALDGGTIRSAGGTNAALGHTGLAHDSRHKVDWRPTISVADAQANEGAGAKVAFQVSLSRAFAWAEHRVTVDYATADGTATAGEDYTATSGTLTFSPGEKTKTVNVTVLDDAVDEGDETFTLTLSNVRGARAGDLEATGTIANDDPLQEMWLSRFGRTVAGHVTDAVSDRLANPLAGAQVTVGGQSVDLAQTEDGAALTQALTGLARALGASEQPASGDGFGSRMGVLDGPGSSGSLSSGTGGRPGTAAGVQDAPALDGAPSRDLSGRELLLGSAFHLAAEGDGTGPGLAAWGRVTVGGFDGEERADDGSLRIDGEVTTGILGADAEWNRLLAGVAVSVSEGEGTFDQPGVDKGGIESAMTTVSPYARFMVNDRLSVWGLAGWGTGDMTIVQAANENQPERVTRTGLEMRLAAAGGRGALVQADETGGIDLGLRADAFYVETEAEAVSNEGGTTAVASRVRLALEGSRAFDIGGGTLTPGAELGLRHDGGDAETGTGVELGGRVTWTDPDSGLSVEARARTLVAHEASDYREWGASGAVRLAPGARDRGLSFSLTPTWGAASSGVERLWSAGDARGLAPGAGTGAGFEAGQRLEGELGYGLGLFGDRFTGTPNVGFGLSDTTRDYRVGWRLTAPGEAGFEVSLDATRREVANPVSGSGAGPGSASGAGYGAGIGPEHGVMLRGAIRW